MKFTNNCASLSDYLHLVIDTYTCQSNGIEVNHFCADLTQIFSLIPAGKSIKFNTQSNIPNGLFFILPSIYPELYSVNEEISLSIKIVILTLLTSEPQAIPRTRMGFGYPSVSPIIQNVFIHMRSLSLIHFDNIMIVIRLLQLPTHVIL